MDLEAIEKVLQPTRSRYRPVIWREIGRYSIDPPEQLCSKNIYKQILYVRDRPEFWPSVSTIHSELLTLERLEMLEGTVCNAPPRSADWFVRTDPEAWDVAFEIMSRSPTPEV